MDNLSLFTLLLACATFLLAGASFWSIWQNYKLREKDRKERLLNEIIGWANNFTQRPKLGIEEFSSTKDIKDFLYRHRACIQDVINELVGYSGRSLYISSIGVKFGTSIQQSIKNTLESLNVYINSLSNWRKSIGNDLGDISNNIDIQKSNIEKSKYVDECKIKLELSALNTIEQISKLKIKSID